MARKRMLASGDAAAIGATTAPRVLAHKSGFDTRKLKRRNRTEGEWTINPLTGRREHTNGSYTRVTTRKPWNVERPGRDVWRAF